MNAKLFAIIGLCLAAVACGQTPPEVEAGADAEPVGLPPGFLDEPPPGPTSATTVLSGGTLIIDDVISDAVVVVQNGVLLAWGARGEVDMPNDSVGLDMRGKWIVPGAQDALQANGNLPDLTLWQAGKPANLLILTSDPGQNDPGSNDLAGVVADGEIRIFDTP